MYISPEGGCRLHSETLTSIALGLSLQPEDHPTPNTLQTFLQDELEHDRIRRENDESTQVYRKLQQVLLDSQKQIISMDHGHSPAYDEPMDTTMTTITTITMEENSSSLSQHSNSAPPGHESNTKQQQIETLDQYRARLHTRKALRHEMRLALQQQNPDSHYQHVELYSEYNDSKHFT